jgi:hypothetical protein
MPLLTSNTTLSGVKRVKRPESIGFIYRAELSVEELFELIRYNRIQYSPLTQRGFAERKDRTDAEFDQLLSLNDDDVQIDNSRAQQMAVKFLMGRLFSANIVWNARRDDDVEPDYDSDSQTLSIKTTITVPDTAHRHRFYYLLGLWKKDPERVPSKVTIYEGQDVTQEEIHELLDEFEPEHAFVFCDVYNISAEQEGQLYDEFNSESKPPSSATAIDQFQKKTPARRFMVQLMENTAIFAREEIETRYNTIASKSRKLTTNATMVAAIKGMTRTARELTLLEQDEARYKDLVAFFDAFFQEWAQYFPEFEPGTESGPRQDLRKTSFALSNVMMHPLFKLVYDVWHGFDESNEDWRQQTSWKDAVAKLGGTYSVIDPESGEEIVVRVMDRDNPAWRERILVPKYDKTGALVDWIVSSTRETRLAAYAYLHQVADMH